MRIAIVCLALMSTLAVSVPAAQAQQVASDCRYAGMAYGLAATVRDGDKVLRCGPSGWFADPASANTNCLYASGVFTSGAIVTEGDKTITCQADGTWLVAP